MSACKDHLGNPCQCLKTNSDNIFYAGPNMPCLDVDTNENLTLILQKIDFKLCNSGVQNNFVRQLLINDTDLPDPYTVQDICDYILALPDSEKTISQTDSKWNVIIKTITDEFLEIYEIQNIGEGIITILNPPNLLLIESKAQDFQDVLSKGNNTTLSAIFNGDSFNPQLTATLGAFGGLYLTNAVSNVNTRVDNTGIIVYDIPNGLTTSVNAGGVTFNNGLLRRNVLSTSFSNINLPATNGTDVTLATLADIIASNTPDATAVIKGKLKLTNDLGGTADLPTTPTAIHITGNETKAGQLIVTPVITSLNALVATSLTGYGVQGFSNTLSGVQGISSGVGNGVWGEASTGSGVFARSNMGVPIVADATAGAKIASFTFSNTEVANIMSTGQFTGNSFVKIGGLPTQFLKADGSVDTTIYAIDSNVIHISGNETKTGNLTVNAIIKSGGLSSEYLMADGSTSTTANFLTQTITNGDITHAPSSNIVYNTLLLKEDIANKGIPNGYASLDAGGKIPIGQLPNSVMEFKGFWDASTNTPTLANGIGNTGDVWECNVAGTVDFGAGNITFKVGDWAVYTSLATWEKSLNSNEVTSVFGRVGTVVALNGDYNTGLVPEVTDKNYQTDLQKLYNDATSSIQTQLNSKQATLISGTNIKTLEGQSLLGSGNIDLTKSDIGLGNVDNTSDLNKPISTATQTALNLKSDLLSPIFTGNPTAPTPLAGDNDTSIATTAFVTGALSTLDSTLLHKTGNEIKTGNLTVNSIITAGATSLQFVKGDGSLDSTLYTPTTRTININGVTQDLSANRQWRAGLSNTGALTYAGISVASTTTVNIGAVSGIITNNETTPGTPSYILVTYAGGTGITVPTIGSGTGTYVLLSSAGTLIFQNTFPTSAQRKTSIYLSKISHPNLTSISFAIDEPDFVTSPLQQYRDLFQVIQYMNQGVLATGNAGLTFNTTNGNILGDGINFVADRTNPNMLALSAASPRSFLLLNQSGAVGSFITTVDPTTYDVGGVTTTIPGGNNRCTNQQLFYAPGVGFAIQRGQNWYANMADAIAAVGRESFVVRANLVNNSILIGILVLRKGGTNLNDLNDCQILPADKFGQIGGAAAGIATTNLQTAYNNSLVPQITTTAALGAVTIKEGGALDTDNVFAIQNLAGTNTANINGSGIFSGLSFNSNGSISAASAIARGNYFNNTLVATANNDVLIGLDIAPTFTNGAFTGVTNAAMRIAGDILPSANNIYNLGSTSNNFLTVRTQNLTYAGGTLQINASSSASGTIQLKTNSITNQQIFLSGNITMQTGGTFTDSGFKLDVKGTNRMDSLVDGPTVGSELGTTATGTNWTGTSLLLGYTHTPGSTVALTSSQVTIATRVYRLVQTVTGRTAGSYTISIGGSAPSLALTATNTQYQETVNTTGLVITPTTDFDGTVAVSIVLVSNTILTPTLTLANPTSTNPIEFRSLGGSSNLIGIGINAGGRFTGFTSTGGQTSLIAIGGNVLPNCTVGSNNIGMGTNAGSLLRTGNQNMLFGISTGSSITAASDNSMFGYTTGINLVSSNANTLLGSQAGRFLNDKSTTLTILNNSIFLGYRTSALTNGDTNSIVIGVDAQGLGSNKTVIGNSSTVQTHLYGRLTVGSTTDNGFNFEVTGTSRLSGKVTFVASTTLAAMMNLPVGVAPTTPNDGDVWLESNTNTGLKIRIAGVTKTISLV